MKEEIFKYKIIKSSICLTALLVLMTSCSGGSSKPDCAVGTPSPMFSDVLPGISDYTFSVSEQNSEEVFLFNKNKITIHQSGCDLIQQEFQFYFPKGKSAEQLSDLISGYFIDFAQLGPEQAGFLAWSQAIDEFRSTVKIGEAFSPAPGIQITIDRIQQADNDLVLLKLEMSQI